MIKEGTSRWVIVFSLFVIKIPKIHPLQALRWLRFAIKDIFSGNHKQVGTDILFFSSCIFDGIRANLNEARFYIATRHRLLSRLYLPLIILNVYQSEVGVGNFDLIERGVRREAWNSGDEEFYWSVQNCGHTFDNPDNFSYDGKKIKIIDYADDALRSLLLRYGDRIESILLSMARRSKPSA